MTKTSLKNKISLYSSLVFFVLMPLTTVIALNYFQSTFTRSIEEQLFSSVTLHGKALDRKISSIHSALISEASGVPPEILLDPHQAQSYLNHKSGLLSFFDYGLVLLSKDGEIVAETRHKPSRTGTNLSQRSDIHITLRTRGAQLSEPYMTPEGRPVFVLTAPILNPQGELSGILTGTIDLLGENFTGYLKTAKIGQTGYFYIYTQDRTIVIHPDQSRIMKQDVPIGANKLFDKALEGFEGAGETVNSRGLHTLSAFTHLRSTDWILAANFPIAEAYSTIRMTKGMAWLFVVLGGGVVATIMWLATKQLVGPLIFLTEEIREITNSQSHNKRVQVNTRDEIGELATSFNSMMTELEKRELELAESQELFQTLADWSTNWIFWKSTSGKMLYISPAASRITGYSISELMEFSEHFEELVHPDDRGVWQHHQHEANTGKETPSLDFRIITKNGETRWLSHFCQPIYNENGEYIGLRGSNADITERKKNEDQLLHLSTRDSLTGLYNRGYFDTELERFARGRHFPVSLVVADLDQLKPINDTLGHAAGDQMIQGAAGLLVEAFRTDDVVARIGGDEFAVLMPKSNEDGVNRAIERLRELEAQHNRSERNLNVGFSIGRVTATDSETLKTALSTADARMYEDKRQRKAGRQDARRY